ncbi:MAG: Sulfur carrier protein ThiS [Burkholderiaceae bacterium]|jgi:sulfur carrier protein|nr:MAG: Sulfur carrier protein ThiS [Burkholderiaceae bacterium]
MNVFINQNERELADGATLADAIALLNVHPPFAAAVNLQFIPRPQHAQTLLQPGDRVEVIVPVTGG